MHIRHQGRRSGRRCTCLRKIEQGLVRLISSKIILLLLHTNQKCISFLRFRTKTIFFHFQKHRHDRFEPMNLCIQIIDFPFQLHAFDRSYFFALFTDLLLGPQYGYVMLKLVDICLLLLARYLS